MDVERDSYGVSQDFADQAMLKVPQVMHANTRHSKALTQVRSDRFDFFCANARTL